MTPTPPAHRARLAVLCLLMAALPVRAQEPGAIERFTDQAVSETWRVLDEASGGFFIPVWQSGGDPYIEYPVESDRPIWFLATTTTSGGKFTGNLSSGLDGLAVDVRIENLSDLYLLDVSVASVTDGKYYQSSAVGEEIFSDDGRATMEVSFSDTWYFNNGGTFEPVDLTQGSLNNVSEVSVRIFPLPGSNALGRVACDNFRLVPTLVAPRLTPSPAPPLEVEFTLLPGHTYQVEESMNLVDWEPRPGYTNLTGTGVVSFPVDPSTPALTYRLDARPYYHE